MENASADKKALSVTLGLDGWSLAVANFLEANRCIRVIQPALGRRPLAAPPSPLIPPPAWLIWILSALPFVVIVLVCSLVIWQIMRRIRRQRQLLGADQKESIWSWSLFWQQCRLLLADLLYLLHHPFGNKQQIIQKRTGWQEELTGDRAARSIREIYRALLTWAARQGCVRQRDETPYEYQQRLITQLEVSEEALTEITRAYTLVRYGASRLSPDEVGRVNHQWAELLKGAST